MATDSREAPGVYAAGGDGAERLVHLYQGGSYSLADVIEIWKLGRLLEAGPEDTCAVELSHLELDRLKGLADAYSFDFEEPFIEMCHEMQRFAATLGPEPIRFAANF